MGDPKDGRTARDEADRDGKGNARHKGDAPAPKGRPKGRARPEVDPRDAPFVRAENEDDDGYDPYSDRRPRPEPLFERDPWD